MQAEYSTTAVTIFDDTGHVEIEDNKEIYEVLISNGL